MGLALSSSANDFGRLPSGCSPREAKVRHLEVGPLHNVLEKGWSEPGWVGNLLTILNEEPPEVKRILFG
jgi:hypothetical protein